MARIPEEELKRLKREVSLERLAESHAAELLQTDYQPSRVSSGSVKRSTVQKRPTTFEGNAEAARLLLQVIEYYHEMLPRLPDALAYLEKRGLGSEQAVRHFKLDFANRTLASRCSSSRSCWCCGVSCRGFQRYRAVGCHRGS